MKREHRVREISVISCDDVAVIMCGDMKVCWWYLGSVGRHGVRLSIVSDVIVW